MKNGQARRAGKDNNMNALQIAEIKRQARLESKTDLNENRKVYALVKNGTNLAKITTNEMTVKHFVQVENFSIWAAYMNGEEVDRNGWQ